MGSFGKKARAGLPIRHAVPDDRAAVRALIAASAWRHQHLDWEDSLEMLERRPFLIAGDSSRPRACLACPVDPPGIAWVRLFVADRSSDPGELWKRLWPAVEKEWGDRPITAAALSRQEWMRSLLLQSGFRETHAVLFLEWEGVPPDRPPPPDILLRGMRADELDAVLAVDHQAFAPLWRLGRRALEAAHEQSDLGTVAQAEDGGMAGYSLSTLSAFGGHLARLAVEPSSQGRGIGSALLADTLRALRRRGVRMVTVNTQSDNLRSLDLYHRFGFRETGQDFPVFERRMPADSGSGPS